MKFKRFISSIFLFLSMTLSSCSLFGGVDEGLMIDRVESSTNEAGNTLVTMYFTDEDVEPLTFEIPKGVTGDVGPIGATGLGIESITSRQSEDGKITILTISFTSDDVPDKEITVPNGVSIVKTNSTFHPETNVTTITFELSDGTVIPGKDDDPIEIENGKDGIGIERIEQETQDDQSIKITIYYSDPSMGEDGKTDLIIPYKNGEDGRGITSVVSTQIEDQFYITVNYTDGTFEDLTPITIPQTTKWLSGLGAPNSIVTNQANYGDYYFDQENFVIYYFDGSNFIELINLTENNKVTEKCTVTFNPNGGTFVSETIGKIQIDSGSTINLASIPLCAKDGFSFEGYYTTPEGPENPLSGRLTDLTPIFSDITFYAYYEEIL